VLSTPPAFVLSQDQTLQTKTPTPKVQAEFKSEKPDKTKQPHPDTGHQGMAKKQQQKQKHQTHY
jgi:hypothetical protein